LEWQSILLLLFGSFVVLMLTGMPVAFCFLLINMMAMYVLLGPAGLQRLILSINTTLASFTLLPIPLFILMGELMFQSGTAPDLIRTLDKWLGRLPGRLSLLAVGSGVLFSTLTGTSLASVAMLGTVLLPEMEQQGYKKSMTIGPILGSGGLAMMIPPSALAVLCGSIGQISIGRILIAIIMAGLLMAVIYTAYIILRCWFQPSVAPIYEVSRTPLSEKLADTVRYILPQGIVVFLVIGVIFLGITTPSEAAATGVVGTIIVAALNRKLSWKVVKKATTGTVLVAGMLFFIIAGATAFAQILAYSGASASLAELATGLPVAPIVIIIAMMIIIVFLGCFMDVVSIMMITLPIFVPVVISLGFSPVWYAVIFLINIEVAGISPPFGMSLFVMKGVVSSDTTMADIYRASLPFCGLSLIAMALIIAFPQIALWLPEIMR
jgi:tripartite ATP-independent transporter DctM subunit